MYGTLVPLLASEFRVVTFDDRGHGRSSDRTGELSYGTTAADAAGLAEALGLDRPFVGGWSDGGQVALEFGLRYPGRARGLIVGGAYADFQSGFATSMIRSLFSVGEDDRVDFDAFQRANGDFAPLLKQWHAASPDQWKTVMQRTVTMCLEYPGLRQEQVATISTPAIVIQGDRDELVPFAEAQNLFGWLPNGEFAVLPATNHFRPLGEPALFAAAIMDFARRHGGSSPGTQAPLTET
jgi:pimeloyl-ACP methyl ester carboxylesterase